jgi:hypothetical protein
MLYAADPWAVIAGCVSEQVANTAERAAATSWVRQAREYFMAAERANTMEPRPLLYYYSSFLKLVKAIAIARGRPDMVGKVMHGGSDRQAWASPVNSRAGVPSVGSRPISRVQVVDDLHRALERRAPVAAGLTETLRESTLAPDFRAVLVLTSKPPQSSI